MHQVIIKVSYRHQQAKRKVLAVQFEAKSHALPWTSSGSCKQTRDTVALMVMTRRMPGVVERTKAQTQERGNAARAQNPAEAGHPGAIGRLLKEAVTSVDGLSSRSASSRMAGAGPRHVNETAWGLAAAFGSWWRY